MQKGETYMIIDYQDVQQIVRQSDSIIFDPDLLKQTFTKSPADYVTLVDKHV